MATFIFWDGEDPSGSITGDPNAKDTIILRTTYSPNDTHFAFVASQVQVTSIDEVRFDPYDGTQGNPGHGITFSVDAALLDGVPGVEFSPVLHVVGHDNPLNREKVVIPMHLAGVTAVDISGWTFANWGGQGKPWRSTAAPTTTRSWHRW